MPHAGLMDESALGPEKGPLQRARLHIRGGRRRLKQGKIPEGIVTLYDALSAALEWYFASPERRGRLAIKASDNLRDERNLFEILVRSGIVEGSFDFGKFSRLIEALLYEDAEDFDHEMVLRQIESVMTQIGVMPFDESALPKEDPSTF